MKYLFLMLVLVSGAVSANTTCTGQISQVYFNPIGGHIHINYGYGTNILCSVETELVGIKPNSCKVLYSGLLAAQAQGRKVEIRYNGDFTCSSQELGHFISPTKEAYLISYFD